MKNCNNYRSTFSKDILPKTMKENESTIVNLQDYYFAGEGTHWVCLYNDMQSVDIEYFDSFGLVLPNEILRYMKTTSKNIIYNDIQILMSDSIFCGYYCLYFITERNKGRKAKEILLDFHKQPTEFNETFMKLYVACIKNENLLCKEKRKTK